MVRRKKEIPFGFPVLPEVYMMMAGEEADGGTGSASSHTHNLLYVLKFLSVFIPWWMIFYEDFLNTQYFPRLHLVSWIRVCFKIFFLQFVMQRAWSTTVCMYPVVYRFVIDQPQRREKKNRNSVRNY